MKKNDDHLKPNWSFCQKVIFIVLMCLLAVIASAGVLLFVIWDFFMVGGILLAVGFIPLIIIGVYIYLRYC